MKQEILKRTAKFSKLVIVGIVIVLFATLMGCNSAKQQSTTTTSAKGQETKLEEKTSLRIGTLQTEDTLAINVAEKEGLFKNIDVKLTVFKSAQERDAALQAGQIDGFMGDIVAAAALYQGGTPVQIVSIMLGSQPTEGRFGIVSSPKSNIKTIDQLKGVPIATSSNTITEYVVDSLLQENGFGESDIKKVEIKALPVRLEALLNGQVNAAALPDPLLFFAQSKGANLIIDDTRGSNLSQTILLFRKDFLDKSEQNKEAVKSLLEVCNQAVEMINANPDNYRALLVEKAKLPEPIANTYKINTYPKAKLPTKQEVDQLLNWMRKKGILKTNISYEQLINQEVQPS